MAKSSTPVRNWLLIFPNLLILIGVLFLVGGSSQYFLGKKAQSAPPQSKLIADTATLTERKLAIDQAIKNGDKTYTFTSNYTPGLGRISDPSAYEKSWLQNIQSTMPDLKNAPAIGNYLPTN